MDGRNSFLVRAMSATVETAAGFDPMANNLAPAMITFRRHGVDGALEAIKIVGDPGSHDFDRFIVFISTNFALIHNIYSSGKP